MATQGRTPTETALASGQPILIYTPGARGLLRLLRIWLLMFVAVLLSYGVFWYISIPAFVFTGIRFPSFLEYWSLYGYSRPALFVSTAIVLIVLFLTADRARTLVICIIKLVLGL